MLITAARRYPGTLDSFIKTWALSVGEDVITSRGVGIVCAHDMGGIHQVIGRSEEEALTKLLRLLYGENAQVQVNT